MKTPMKPIKVWALVKHGKPIIEDGCPCAYITRKAARLNRFPNSGECVVRYELREVPAK